MEAARDNCRPRMTAQGDGWRRGDGMGGRAEQQCSGCRETPWRLGCKMGMGGWMGEGEIKAGTGGGKRPV